MRRRNFLAGAATLGAVLPSLAQTGGAIRRIGVLGNNPPSLPVVVPLWARVAVAGAMWRIDQEREGLGPGTRRSTWSCNASWDGRPGTLV